MAAQYGNKCPNRRKIYECMEGRLKGGQATVLGNAEYQNIRDNRRLSDDEIQSKTGMMK
jgi:hypothetical protein